MSKKIALIGFGGTIAMVPNEEGALAPASSADELVKHAPGLNDLGANLTVINLENKDSTNVNPKDWLVLINAIYEMHHDYDGFIVTHGTDTMPYTATATSFALAGREALKKPVVFTGSQLPIVDPGTDARVNLERAMRILLEAVEKDISETMIVFGDRVLRASRTIKTSEARFDAFDSPAFTHLADITATPTVFSPLAQTSLPKESSFSSHKGFDNRVVSMDVSPGLKPDALRHVALSEQCSGLILKSLGAGNVPSEGEYSFIPVIEEIVASKKPVIIATKFVGGKTIPEIYETGRLALKAGAGHAGNMTDVAAEVKLMWLLSQGVKEPKLVKEHMLKSYVGEVG